MLGELLRQRRAEEIPSGKQALLKSMTALWDLHPEAAFFRAQGGDEIPPPVSCNLSLTNKCNLRCEICGSQKHLDATGILRRHMDIARVEAVARTLFPVMAVVELNSQGDPLLHPQIERVLELVAEHKCEITIQTNGTLFTNRVVDLLMRQIGTINLSLDAVGPRFDEVRRGGVWARAEPGLENFLGRRDPADLWVGIYPTVTRRTLGDAMAIVQWAHDHDADEVAFHRYIPIHNSFEEAPRSDELAGLKDELRKWAAAHPKTMKISLEGNVVVANWRNRRRSIAHPIKHDFKIPAMMAPMESTMNCADPVTICVAPEHYVEIGLEGQISACCRAQDVTLGFATSPEAFAKAWFGKNYRAIRASLQRDAKGPFPLPNCEGCIAGFAPNSLRGRRATEYDEDGDTEERLDYHDWDEWVIEVIQKESGHCHIALTPPGMDLSQYRLYEDEIPLRPRGAPHEDIREEGKGRYSLSDGRIYFATSDNSDARRNDRRYTLRRGTDEDIDYSDLDAWEIELILKEDGHCHVATAPPGMDLTQYRLYEGEIPLRPRGAPHEDIRQEGMGRYSLSGGRIYFATSDNSDARRNGRSYTLRRSGDENVDYGDLDEWEIELILKEDGHCHVATAPPGMDLTQYRLYEDEIPLRWRGAQHEEIREGGRGRYSLWEDKVYFATSDNSDARHNGRRYTLRRSSEEDNHYGDLDEWVIELILKEDGHCHVATALPGMDLSQYYLYEDAIALGPLDRLHDEIRQEGKGRYSLWHGKIYFAASDNSDARHNGRRYALRRREMSGSPR